MKYALISALAAATMGTALAAKPVQPENFTLHMKTPQGAMALGGNPFSLKQCMNAANVYARQKNLEKDATAECQSSGMSVKGTLNKNGFVWKWNS